ncbi:MAG: undecaprenyl-diphosphate phosphatase [Candidatus Omnitrophota bacterium]
MIKYVFLGIIQGLTEFLPVSSSGHLVVMQNILSITADHVAVSVVLHLGTLLAVVLFFRKDILSLLKNPKLLGLSAVVVVITGIIGVLGKDFFESLFSSVKLVGVAWIFTGLLLISTKNFTQGNKDKFGVVDALILGLTQGLAIIPGVSRSGITISTLFFRGIQRQLAFVLSFLISIPIILGAALLEAKKIGAVSAADSINLAVGFLVSFITGLFALLLLRLVINKAKFYYFGYYCLFMAIITLLFIK